MAWELTSLKAVAGGDEAGDAIAISGSAGMGAGPLALLLPNPEAAALLMPCFKASTRRLLEFMLPRFMLPDSMCRTGKEYLASISPPNTRRPKGAGCGVSRSCCIVGRGA